MPLNLTLMTKTIMLIRLLFFLLVLFVPIHVWAQEQPARSGPKATGEIAAVELNLIIAEAGKLDDKLAMINIQARVANVISTSDPVRAETMFLDLWKFAKTHEAEGFDTERALTLILKNLMPRNRKLARQLLSDAPKADEPSLESRATGRDPVAQRATNLALQLVDENPREASEILESNLSTGMTQRGLTALTQLRAKDPLLADFVAAKVMDGLRSQPDVLSLSGLQLLSAYVFPESSGIEFNSSLEALQRQYFSTTLDALRASLAESEAALVKDRHYTPGDLRFRAMNQARVSMTLAALAGRFRPDVSAELNALANKLGPQLPPNVAELARYTTSRLAGTQTTRDPAMAIPNALSSGNFDEASRLIDDLKNDELKKTYLQLLPKLQAKSFLLKADVMGALTWIRKVEDQSARLVLYLETLKAAQKKRDASLVGLVLNEAVTLIPQVDRNGLHVRALLAFASQLSSLASMDEAMIFLNAAVTAINSLPKRPEQTAATDSLAELAWNEINDPLSLLDAKELDRAFAAIGGIDLERASTTALKIEVKPVQLAARLEAVGEAIRVDARKPKPSQKAATKPRQ